MKKSKLLLLVTLLLSVVALIAACGDSTTGTTGKATTSQSPATTTPQAVGTTTETTPTTTETPPPTQLTSIKINGTDISQYTIVYAQSKYATYIKLPQYRRVLPVYDFDHETADRLAALIQEKLGVQLTVAEDVKTAQSDYEILIGKTNRTDVSSALGFNTLTTDDYKIGVSGTKLAVCGGEYGTTWHAIDYLETLIEETLASRNTELAFDAAYSYASTHHLIQIGCIGDSITAGVGSSNAEEFAYPAQLGRFLWKDAIVTAFGNSGKTMRDDLTDSYYKTDTYTNACNAAANIDLFTIMLGTNDSNRDRSWTGTDSQTYINDCIKILTGLKAENPDLQFVLANCPAYFGTDAYGSATVRTVQQRMISDLNDAGFPTTFFDMYEITKDQKVNFPDSLHPNDQGHLAMAEGLSAALQEKINQLQEK